MRTTVTIGGMSCVHCRRAVFTALAGVTGVISADVSIGSAEIEHDASVTLDSIRSAIATAGYEVTAAARDSRILPQLP